MTTPRARRHRSLAALAAAALVWVGLTLPAAAQNPFSAAVTVGDSIVTHYEITQRAEFLKAVRTPGDLQDQALEALVNERLQRAEAERLDLTPTAEQIEAGVTEFAARAGMGPEQFIRALSEEGVAPETFRDFIAAGIAWRGVVEARFASRVRISDEDVEQALALATDRDAAQILIAEVIIPLTPQNEEDLFDEMARLSRELDGNSERFSEAARRFSRADTAEDGGMSGWRAISAVPPALLEALITAPNGRTTPPLSLGNAIGIFQMRGLRETGLPARRIASVDYLTLPLPGDAAEGSLAAAAALRAEVDVCDDFYGTRPGAFDRVESAPGAIPRDISVALSRLDPGEMAFDVFRNNGATRLAVMLCGRSFAAAEDAEATMRRRLFAQQIDSYAEGLLEELRADALIDYTP